ncbi:TPA_asm: protein 4 [Didymochlaena virus 1]|uniref:Protein 4 n=1 Tax=Didymochlaena virus 1 TaxID=2977966 RepID=A0A9N6YJ25_9RHAB|nr:TPA_asm: protein 4 [Didymochlaena virus 1]
MDRVIDSFADIACKIAAMLIQPQAAVIRELQSRLTLPSHPNTSDDILRSLLEEVTDSEVECSICPTLVDKLTQGYTKERSNDLLCKLFPLLVNEQNMVQRALCVGCMKYLIMTNNPLVTYSTMLESRLEVRGFAEDSSVIRDTGALLWKPQDITRRKRMKRRKRRAPIVFPGGQQNPRRQNGSSSSS